MNNELNILVKFPTRERPLKFLEVFKKYIEFTDTKNNIKFLVSYDEDDLTMTTDILLQAQSYSIDNTILIKGKSKNKIDACNRDINIVSEEFRWDILILASDDMTPLYKGYDTVIRNNMKKYYPDTDGVLFFNDGFRKNNLNTMCILGKNYYQRFNYIYHPSYISLWCDNEFMEVANILKKQTYFNDILFKHDHPVNTGEKRDSLYNKNESYFNIDKQNYLKRKSLNFR